LNFFESLTRLSFLLFFFASFLLRPSSLSVLTALLFFLAGASLLAPSSSSSPLPLRADLFFLFFFATFAALSSGSLDGAADVDVATMALPNTAFNSAADFVDKSFAAECFLYLRPTDSNKADVQRGG